MGKHEFRVAIGFSLASDRLKKWREFRDKSHDEVKQNQCNPNLLLVLNRKSVIAWSKCYQFANLSTARAMDVLHIKSFLDGDQILWKLISRDS